MIGGEDARPGGPLRRAGASLPVSPRPLGHPEYAVYGDSLDAPEVHVHVRVVEQLRRATRDATIGALLGRPCRDDYGIYVVVEQATTAAFEDHIASDAGVGLSALGCTENGRAAQLHPTLEAVGWWHAGGLPRDRAPALDEEASRPYRVGIVVGPSPAGGSSNRLDVHVGPSATLLSRRGGAPEDVT